MINFSEVSFTEFSELVNFLAEKNPDLLIERITRFFPKMDALKRFELNSITTLIIDNNINDAEKAFNTFKEAYPDLEFDPSGKSEPVIKGDYWEIKLKSLDNIFEVAKHQLENNNFADDSPKKVNTQVYNAKTLEVLKQVKPQYNYYFNKMKFLKINDDRNIVEYLEKVIQRLTGSKEPLNKYFEYIMRKKPENCEFFVKHFIERVDILNQDKELKNTSNIEFLEKIKELK